jgi:hypothetical protein
VSSPGASAAVVAAAAAAAADTTPSSQLDSCEWPPFSRMRKADGKLARISAFETEFDFNALEKGDFLRRVDVTLSGSSPMDTLMCDVRRATCDDCCCWWLRLRLWVWVVTIKKRDDEVVAALMMLMMTMLTKMMMMHFVCKKCV